MSPELLIGRQPDGLPLALYLEMLELQDREIRELKKAQAKRARKR